MQTDRAPVSFGKPDEVARVPQRPGRDPQGRRRRGRAAGLPARLALVQRREADRQDRRAARRRTSSTTSAAGWRSAWTTAPSSSPGPGDVTSLPRATTPGSSATSRSSSSTGSAPATTPSSKGTNDGCDRAHREVRRDVASARPPRRVGHAHRGLRLRTPPAPAPTAPAMSGRSASGRHGNRSSTTPTASSTPRRPSPPVIAWSSAGGTLGRLVTSGGSTCSGSRRPGGGEALLREGLNRPASALRDLRLQRGDAFGEPGLLGASTAAGSSSRSTAAGVVGGRRPCP